MMSTDSSALKVMELFSPPPRVTAEILEGQREGLYQTLFVTTPSSYDLETGWDFFNVNDRRQFWKDLAQQDPDVVIMTPECKGFSCLMNVNWDRMSSAERKELETRAMVMFQFCIQVAEHRIRRGKFFVLEQPDKVTSWNTHAARWLSKQREVLHLSFDQCAAGLQVSEEGWSRKRISFTCSTTLESATSFRGCNVQETIHTFV